MLYVLVYIIICSRVIALVSMVIEVHMTDGWRGDCSGGFLWYPIMTIGLLALLTVNDVFIAVQSAKGGVFDKKARHNIPVLLYIRTGEFIYVQLSLYMYR